MVSSPMGLVGRVGGGKLGACGWDGAGKDEAGEGAVDVAAGVDALYDLLAEVAALGEVEGSGLCGLLGEILGGVRVADVGAVERCAFEDSEEFQVCDGDGRGFRGAEFLEDNCDGCWVGPDLEARDEGAVGLDERDWGSRVNGLLEVEGLG